MKKLLILCAALLALAGCKKTPSAHPDWTYGSVMYEVNIRQFSPEGTFAGVEAQLLAGAGIEAVMEGENVVKPELALTWGNFIQVIFDFIIIAFCIFLVVKGLNSLKKKEEPAPEAPKGPSQEELLTEIRDLLKNK